MKRLIFALAMTLAAISFTSAFAAETTIEGRIYSTWSMRMSEGIDTIDTKIVDLKGFSKFSVDRSYVTVKSKLSDYVSLAITTDLRDATGEDTSFKGNWIILKNAYVDWRLNFAPDLMTLRLGLQSTKYMELADGTIWGRRYMEKSIGDLHEFLTTADLGANLNFNIGDKGKWGTAGLGLWNGSKYTDLNEKNANKDISIHGIFKPLVDNPDFDKTVVGAQIYLGTQNRSFDTLSTAATASDYKNQVISLGGKFNYKSYFDIGLEYWMATLGQGASPDLKKTALSFAVAVYAKPFVAETSPIRTLDLVIRYDMYNPNTDAPTNTKVKQNYMIVGIECVPIKGVASSINYKSRSYEDSAIKSVNYLFWNTEFRF